MGKVKIGIIGLGVGEKHIEGFETHSVCRVVALCDFSNEKLKEITQRYADTKATKRAEEILVDPAIDIVSVASYDNYHAEQIVGALDNGKHVFVEKPLCLNEGEMHKIIAALNRKPGLKLSSNLVLRTNPRFSRIRDDIQRGSFGDVYYIEADYMWGRIEKLYGWRSTMPFYSIIYGAAVHMVDLVMWLTGERPHEVNACGNSIATLETPLHYNSFAVLLLKFPSGRVAKVTGNGGCVHPHFHGLKVFGTKKTAIHDLAGSVWVNSGDPDALPKPIDEPYPAKELRKDVIISFVDHILDEAKKPLVPKQDVFDVMSVCFAAEKAMQDNITVKIDYM